MTRIVALLLSFGLVACAPPPPVPEPRPNASEGTHYHLAGGTALLTCNTWGFDTICRTNGR
jgi:hypothetical protein